MNQVYHSVPLMSTVNGGCPEARQCAGAGDTATDGTPSTIELELPEAPKTAEASEPSETAPSKKRTRTPATEISDNEKLMLATIPQLSDFKGVDSEMNGLAFVKKAEELHGIPLNRVRALFASLKAKGYYTVKGKEVGQSRTTFQLSKSGIQYLTDNGLLTVA